MFNNSIKISIPPLVLAAALLALSLSPAVSSAGTESFRDGLRFFENRSYIPAIKSFESARKELPLIEDYLLLYTARAYFEMGDQKRAGKTLGRLLRKHSNSPVRKDALRLQIQNTLVKDEARTMRLLEPFLRTYPRECEELYLLGTIYKRRSKTALATAQFKKLYALPCALSKKANQELRAVGPGSAGPGAADHLKRAENLLGEYRFKEAELTLRTALKKEKGELRDDLLLALGRSLFRQKRYTEAADAYTEAEDLYSAARSLYRCGNEERFVKALDGLRKMRDKRAAALILAHASDKRRDGETVEALKLFESVRYKYPRKSAEAVWLIGWTHYMNRNYNEAIKAFGDLYGVFDDTRSLYWMARATEKTGRKAAHLYTKLREADDFYGTLARSRSGAVKTSFDGTLAPISRKDTVFMPEIERADLLYAVGLKKEAISEIRLLASRAEDPHAVAALAYRLHDLGEYNRAISLLWRIPVKMRPQEVLYPTAYWLHVKAAAGEYGLDPYLLLSVMREESRFNREAYSVAGAMGLMQLMPSTAKRLAKALNMKITGTDDIYDVRVNLKLGSFYLSRLIKEFGSHFPALAAYNAGESNVRRWLKRGRYESFDEFVEDIPYPETKKYIKRIMTTHYRYSLLMQPS